MFIETRLIHSDEDLRLYFLPYWLGDPRCFAFIAETLRTTRIPARKLCFEVTETAAIANLRIAVELLERLRALGCVMALDDFGTGLASFEYVRTLKVD